MLPSDYSNQWLYINCFWQLVAICDWFTCLYLVIAFILFHCVQFINLLNF